MIVVEPATPFESVHDTGVTGQVGTFAWQIVDNIGNIVLGPDTAHVVETPAGSGVYAISIPAAPGTVGQYSVVASIDGTFGPSTVSVDDLLVVAATAGRIPPVAPAPGGPGTDFGPCTPWIGAADVTDCDSSLDGSDQADLVDYVALQSGELLFELSGRQFTGLCGPTTVRPCVGRCRCVDSRWAASQWSWTGLSWLWDGRRRGGCRPVSSVKLAGYPVRAIVEVKIDGVAIDPAGYRLDRQRDLIRMRDPAAPTKRVLWPGCQKLDLEDTEAGTFAVTYTWGQDPPRGGVKAAAQLAAELARACNGGECKIPSGVVRSTRAGVTIERESLSTFLQTGSTGLVLVDAFLAAYNGQRQRRRGAVWSPDVDPFPRRMG